MAKRAFSIEDGNITGNTIISSTSRAYSDIDLAFLARPSGDIYKKTQVAAVKQAIKSLLLTGQNEKPFAPSFGGDLGTALFELHTDYEPKSLADKIANAIQRHEPRALVLEVALDTIPDRNELKARITFQVLNIGEVVTLDVNLARLR